VEHLRLRKRRVDSARRRAHIKNVKDEKRSFQQTQKLTLRNFLSYLSLTKKTTLNATKNLSSKKSKKMKESSPNKNWPKDKKTAKKPKELQRKRNKNGIKLK
jgi:hypothetical protein